MMDYSLLSTHESSMNFPDKTHSVLQSQEVESQFSEYSNIMEYQSNSKISEICTEFREITKKCSEQNNYLIMLNGYICNLSEFLACTVKNMSLLPKTNDCDLFLTSSLIHNEMKTWKLIYLLYEDRFRTATIEPTLLTARPSELELIRDLYDNNTNLREAQIVVDWLEYFTREKVDKNADFLMGSHGKAWEQTKHTIRKMNNFMISRNNVANELDPDAPLRGCLNLTDNDKNDENEYLRYLFHCLQSGDSEKAQMLCQSHDELWRGLTLEGWKPFHNPLFKDDDLNNTDVMGNPNRVIFRSACKQLSQDSKLNKYERAIYGIFCGNIDALSLVVHDWDGLMWAYFKVYIENVIDDHLRTYTINGVFGSQSLFGDNDDDFDLVSLGFITPPTRPMTLTHTTREQIFEEIASKLVYNPMEMIKTVTRPGYKLPSSFYQSIFEAVQQFIIVSDIEGLLQYIEMVLSRLSTKKTATDKLILRFLAHVVIFVFSIYDHMNIESYHRVLEQYIECLINDHSLDNVSFYVSKLSTDLQIKWYSQCMMRVTDYDGKRRCVMEALNYDLPMVDISRRVVRSLRLAMVEMPLLPSASAKRRDTVIIADHDRTKIDALDWLTFLPQQFPHLLRQTNALSRSFLVNEKLSAAQLALSKTPKEIISQLTKNSAEPRWLAAAIYENLCLKAFVAAYEAYGEWSNHLSSDKPPMRDFSMEEDVNKLSFYEKELLEKEYEEYSLSVQQWQTRANYNGQRVLDLFMNTMRMGDGGWLSEVDVEVEAHEWDGEDYEGDKYEEEEGDNDSWRRRKTEIEALRGKSVVSVSFLLMQVLMKSEMRDKCFELTDLLADDKMRLYEHLNKAQLQKILQQVRQCSLQLMTEGHDPLAM